MLYEIAHIIKNRFLFLWKVVEWGNATLFYLMHKKKLMEINSVLEQVSNVYRFRTTTEEDVKKLVDFFARQPEEAFEFFKPHGFDGKAIREVVKNKSFLTFVVLKDDVTVGYFFLRCFVNGKCFRGKIVHKDWQGRGIAKLVVDMLRSEQERVIAIVTEAMESAAALRVRLVVDCGVGGNWLEAH